MCHPLAAGKRKCKRKNDVSVREWKRRKGYELLRKDVRKADIARTLKVSCNTVGRWEKKMKNGDSSSWTNVKPPGKPPKLRVKQRQALLKILVKSALARGHPCKCWSRICQFRPIAAIGRFRQNFQGIL